jgi:hypothetical protein
VMALYKLLNNARSDSLSMAPRLHFRIVLGEVYQHSI